MTPPKLAPSVTETAVPVTNDNSSIADPAVTTNHVTTVSDATVIDDDAVLAPTGTGEAVIDDTASDTTSSADNTDASDPNSTGTAVNNAPLLLLQSLKHPMWGGCQRAWECLMNN